MIDSHYFINVVCGAPRLTGCAACSVNLPLNYDKLLLWSTFDNCKHVVQCSALAMVRFPSGTQNFSLSHARVIVEKDHLHYLSPSLKSTIFIIYYTIDDFDIADPSSMQDACHISA